MSNFTVNPETCPKCSTDDDAVRLRGGVCPECGYTASDGNDNRIADGSGDGSGDDSPDGSGDGGGGGS